MPFSKKKSSLILILDVQTSIVRGSLCILTPGERPSIVFSHETPVEYNKDRGGNHLLETTIYAVKETIHAVLVNIHGHSLDYVHYVLSSPLIVSSAKTIHVDFVKDAKITPSHLMALIAEQRSELVFTSEFGFEIIEEKVFDVKLNGALMQEWHGKKASQVEVSFVTTIAGSDTIKRLREACTNAATPNKVVFHSSLLLQHISIQQTIPGYKDYTLIHAHGELTDVLQVHAGLCTFFGSFPYGTRSVARDVSKALKVSDHTAESNITLYEQGNLDASHGRTTHVAIQGSQHVWTAELIKMLNRAGTKTNTDGHTLISAHAHEAFFIHALQSMPHSGKIQRLELDDVRPRVIFESNVRTSRLTGLYAIAIHSIS